MKRLFPPAILFLALSGAAALAQPPPNPAELAAAAKARAENPNRPAPWWDEAKLKGDDWYRSAEGRRMADNILSWQDKAAGGWPLMNTSREPFTGDVTRAGPWGVNASMIKASVNEVRFLARGYRATGDERYRTAATQGINFILKAQYPSGGWPHSYPLRDDYSKWATYNDDMMSDLMRLLLEVQTEPRYRSLDSSLPGKAKAAFDRGIDFILKSQIRVDGKLTAWGQQHDPVTYEPKPARTFEPVAITGGESASVLLLLMSLEKPSPAVKAAIEGGVDWYRRSQINGLRLIQADGDRVVRPDPSAPPLWARFYDIKSNRPIFSGRDAVIKFEMAQIEKERRGGYAWYNQNGAAVLREYERWKRSAGA